jgi:hypothetical protein
VPLIAAITNIGATVSTNITFLSISRYEYRNSVESVKQNATRKISNNRFLMELMAHCIWNSGFQSNSNKHATIWQVWPGSPDGTNKQDNAEGRS